MSGTLDYNALRAESRALGEHRDCAVVAVAAACGVNYREAHAALERAGRKRRKGTYMHVTEKAVKSLGFKLTPVKHEHHPKSVLRCPDEMPTGRYLIRTSGHILAMVDGKVLDWTAGRRHRPKEILRIVPNCPAREPKPSPKPVGPKRPVPPTITARSYWSLLNPKTSAIIRGMDEWDDEAIERVKINPNSTDPYYRKVAKFKEEALAWVREGLGTSRNS